MTSEVERHLQISLLRREKCSLQYWKHDKKFPLLTQLAAEYLFTATSSVCSDCGNIFREKCAKILPKREEMLMFLRHNGRSFSDEHQVLTDPVDVVIHLCH